MKTASHTALFLILLLASCGYQHKPNLALVTQGPVRPIAMDERVASAGQHILDYDIFQGTCALYVAIRSSALGGPVAFGREIDDSMVQWNICPGGTKVACKVTVTAEGDSVITGIPWPYGAASVH